MTESRIFISIPVHNRIELTLSCLKSIYEQDYKHFQVIICDDGSTDNSASVIKKNYPDTVVLEGDGNLWWTGGINLCIGKALELAHDEDYIYTLNNDTVLQKDTLTSLMSHSSGDMIISSINVFHNEPHRIERSAFIESKLTRRLVSVSRWGEPVGGRTGIMPVSTCSGKGVLIPVNIFRKIGLYNQAKLPHYHADIEFVYRAKQNGWKVMMSFDSKVLSHQELSGLGTVTSSPDVKEFARSFFNIRSTHHLRSLVNYHHLIYKKMAWIYLPINITYIMLGFIKRYVSHTHSPGL